MSQYSQNCPFCFERQLCVQLSLENYVEFSSQDVTLFCKLQEINKIIVHK